MIGEVIKLALQNFSITFLLIGLLGALLSLWRQPKPWKKGAVAETLLAYYVLFCVGFCFLDNFIMHVFFAEICAQFIGWANSPFQYEVGYASLGFAAVGFVAFWSPASRLAAVLGPALFLWGAAGGHVYQMIHAHNFAPGNAGAVFWTDILLPVIGLVLLALRPRGARPEAA